MARGYKIIAGKDGVPGAPGIPSCPDLRHRLTLAARTRARVESVRVGEASCFAEWPSRSHPRRSSRP